MNLLLGKTTHHREAVLYGTFGQGAGCTTLDYTLLQGFTNQQAPLYLYSSRLPRLPRGHLSALREIACGQYIPGVDWPVWRIPWAIDEGPHSGETVLYRRLDPMFKERNLCGVDVMIHRRMNRLIKDMMAEEGTPPEQFYRMGLSRHPEP